MEMEQPEMIEGLSFPVIRDIGSFFTKIAKKCLTFLLDR